MLAIDVNECLLEIPEITFVEQLYRSVYHKVSLPMTAANKYTQAVVDASRNDTVEQKCH